MEGNPDEIQDFLAALEDYESPIPEQVLDHFLIKSGFVCSDEKTKKLISLAAQKFVSDIANDALQHCKIRQAKRKDKKLVLTTEDLATTLKEYGISLRRSVYADSMQAVQKALVD